MVKRALLIGCNYPGTKAALRGCVNDVQSMQNMLVNHFAFPPNHIKQLIDTGNQPEKPTGAAIKKNLNQLVAQCAPGDILFVHFSGHGTQIPDKDGGEEDKLDEAIVPTDLNIIGDDDLSAIFAKLPEGVKLTVVTDCCHSGSMLDYPVQQIAGDKAQGSAVAAVDEGAVREIFGEEGGAGAANRSLPQSDFLATLSEKLGFAVPQGGVHKALHDQFGADASAKTLKALGQLQEFAQKLQGQGGILGKAGGLLGGFMNQAQEQAGALGGLGGALGGGGGEAAPAAAAPAAAAPAAAAKAPPTPGGALITGCQSHETSADACPGNNPANAYGAMTNALTTIVKQKKTAHPNQPISYQDLVTEIRAMLLKAKFTQNPCLECGPETVREAFVC